MGPYIPQDQVVVSPVTGKLVALFNQRFAQDASIFYHLLRVLLETVRLHLQELHGQTANLMIMRTSLQTGENCHVDSLFDIWHFVRVLEKDHSGSRSSQRLVGGGRHNVTMLEGGRMKASGH